MDNINHPPHYASGSIECIDAMLSAFSVEEVVAFCKLNAFKYIWRCGLKANNPTALDLGNATWYIAKAKELIEKK